MQYKTYTKNYIVKMSSADIWIKPGKELIVGDAILAEDTMQYFFDELKILAKQLNAAKISFQTCSNYRLHYLLAGQYEPVPSFPVLFKDFGSGLALEKIKFTFADIDIF
jgi:hypothetical protein